MHAASPQAIIRNPETYAAALTSHHNSFLAGQRLARVTHLVGILLPITALAVTIFTFPPSASLMTICAGVAASSLLLTSISHIATHYKIRRALPEPLIVVWPAPKRINTTINKWNEAEPRKLQLEKQAEGLRARVSELNLALTQAQTANTVWINKKQELEKQAKDFHTNCKQQKIDFELRADVPETFDAKWDLRKGLPNIDPLEPPELTTFNPAPYIGIKSAEWNRGALSQLPDNDELRIKGDTHLRQFDRATQNLQTTRRWIHLSFLAGALPLLMTSLSPLVTLSSLTPTVWVAIAIFALVTVTISTYAQFKARGEPNYLIPMTYTKRDRQDLVETQLREARQQIQDLPDEITRLTKECQDAQHRITTCLTDIKTVQNRARYWSYQFQRLQDQYQMHMQAKEEETARLQADKEKRAQASETRVPPPSPATSIPTSAPSEQALAAPSSNPTLAAPPPSADATSSTTASTSASTQVATGKDPLTALNASSSTGSTVSAGASATASESFEVPADPAGQLAAPAAISTSTKVSVRERPGAAKALLSLFQQAWLSKR